MPGTSYAKVDGKGFEIMHSRLSKLFQIDGDPIFQERNCTDFFWPILKPTSGTSFAKVDGKGLKSFIPVCLNFQECAFVIIVPPLTAGVHILQ
jgi:hypothetical protein